MKSDAKSLQRSLLALLLGCLAISSMAEPEKPGSRTWIERAWEFRYVLIVKSPHDYALSKKVGQELSEKYQAAYEHAPDIAFPLSISLSTDPEHYRGVDKAIGAILINFDENGKVISAYNWPHELHGRLNRIYRLILASGDSPQDIQFWLGKWYTGRSDTEIEYIPAICSMEDMDERYKEGFSAKSYSVDGNFGCREWGYYLQNPQIPYIDVTSYGSDNSTYIRPVTGWGRFDVPPKPVIGKHGDVWVCLHECPNGEAPGIIPNIRLWAARNGWPEPKPPKHQPMFTDRGTKRGESND